VLTLLVQFGGARFHPGKQNLLQPLALLAFVALVALLVVPMLEFVVIRQRRGLRRRRMRRRRQRRDAQAESRARAQMDELCPSGWRAQISLDDSGQVTLDWMELRSALGEPAVVRRVRAPTITAALDAMVEDRRMDETLEQIEQVAHADGIAWPDG
jgi:hypothetical protein